MEIEMLEQGTEIAVLRLTGRLDLVSAAALRSAVEQATGAGRTHVVVDLSGVEFMDSSGVGALVAGLKRARQSGGELRIACPGEQVAMVLELTNINRILRPYESLDDALEGL